MERMKIPAMRENTEIPLPTHSKPTDAAIDLRANETVSIEPNKQHAVATGLKVAIPTGFVGLIWDRSGIAYKNSVSTLGGVIDSNYRGEIKVIMRNFGTESFSIGKGDRIAQMIIQKHETVELIEVESLDETDRGDTGFGNTGVK